MKLINTIFSISTLFAFTDYFEYVKDMYPQLKIGKDLDITEAILPIQPSQVNEIDGVQILSIAAHGDKKGNVSDNPYFGDGSKCKSFGKEPVKECDSEKVCYPNAAHVTSENFMTEKLSKILKDRYPVSFHGHRDRYDKNGKLVHVIIGGLSNQKFKLAEAYHDLNGGSISVAVCKDAKNCRVDGSHITGLSTKNFVNRGKNGCGMQIELSLTFTNSTLINEAHWDSLIRSITKTLPGNEGEICQPKNYIYLIKYFAIRHFNKYFYTIS
ncbi:hypothetical protein CONCODRAFT_6810 [Conidiobolus coronatus NRRL 28638]|uniref:Uncharacterized protein n=1 Tax=Conidiobolus coronatus (strain ATCC 28846 / CBS 209.66 / NRRL 28638) TaxID=796925 RepID=A0A137P6K0_CONC2|nr:hypothetical protein CONCODRAFT_6810 [Conidiobolus coronatus NRRL 28638]|eukprot:KXN70643.1 hypothetical protein CONCODRAFT_6810 [Conidiobolus coronatus NRRL 28638]